MKAAPDEPCSWRENGDGYWDTDCGNCFEFITGGPCENGFTHCPYCGQGLSEIPASTATAPDEGDLEDWYP